MNDSERYELQKRARALRFAIGEMDYAEKSLLPDRDYDETRRVLTDMLQEIDKKIYNPLALR